MATNTVSLSDIDEHLQSEAESIFAKEGRTAAEVYRNLLLRTVEEQHIPIDLFAPNAETLEAMEELRNGGGEKFETVGALMASLHADD